MLDHTDHTGTTRQHKLDHTNHTDHTDHTRSGIYLLGISVGQQTTWNLYRATNYLALV